MRTEVKYFQCEDCGYILSTIETDNVKFKLLEYCPRCNAYPQPFKQVLEEQENE